MIQKVPFRLYKSVKNGCERYFMKDPRPFVIFEIMFMAASEININNESIKINKSSVLLVGSKALNLVSLSQERCSRRNNLAKL